MALAMEYTSGNAKIKIMDFVIKNGVTGLQCGRYMCRVLMRQGSVHMVFNTGAALLDAIVLAAIRANPEKYYALLKQKEEAEEQLTATRRKS